MPDSLKREVFLRFASFPEVIGVFVALVGNTTTFTILHNRQKYDDELMGRLIDEECKIFDLYPNEHIAFHYVAQCLVDLPF